jgi:hypothetical protein
MIHKRYAFYCLPLLALMSMVRILESKPTTNSLEQIVNDEQTKKFLFVADKLGLVEGEKDVLEQVESKIKKIATSPIAILAYAAIIGIAVKLLVDRYIVQGNRLDAIETFAKAKSSYITWIVTLLPGWKIAQNCATTSYTWLKGDGGQTCYIDETCGIVTGLLTFYVLWKIIHNKKITQNADRREALMDFLAHWPEYEMQTPDILQGFFKSLYARYAANSGSLEFDDKLLDALYNIIIFEQVQQMKSSPA